MRLIAPRSPSISKANIAPPLGTRKIRRATAGRPGAVRDAIVAATLAWAHELESEAEIARRQGELPAGVDPQQLVFQLGAYTSRANAVYQLYGDRRAFERARVAVSNALGWRAVD
jgi:hypothetical protein